MPYILRFPALDAIPAVRAAFFARVPGLDVAVDRDEAMVRLREVHRVALAEGGFASNSLATAEQVHGADVAIAQAGYQAPNCDALISETPGICLGIYVADCAPVYLVDPIQHAIGLVHSGKKGTEQQIVLRTVEAMQRRFHCAPSNLIAQIGPCISPPDYELDFRADIQEQLTSAGLATVIDCGVNTAADLDHFYSYRKELGKTGRMLAALELVAP